MMSSLLKVALFSSALALRLPYRGARLTRTAAAAVVEDAELKAGIAARVCGAWFRTPMGTRADCAGHGTGRSLIPDATYLGAQLLRRGVGAVGEGLGRAHACRAVCVFGSICTCGFS